MPLQDCTICMERLVTASGYEGVLRHKGVRPELVGRLGRCGHMYHLLCLVAMYSNGNKVRGWGAGGVGWRGAGPRTHGTSPRPRTAACSARLAKLSTGRRRGRSRPGRWNSTSSPTPCRASQTPRPSASSTTSPQASRCWAPLLARPGPPESVPLPPPRPATACGLYPAAPHRDLNTPTLGRSSRPEVSHATAISPTTRRAGRWVPGDAAGWALPCPLGPGSLLSPTSPLLLIPQPAPRQQHQPQGHPLLHTSQPIPQSAELWVLTSPYR